MATPPATSQEGAVAAGPVGAAVPGPVGAVGEGPAGAVRLFLTHVCFFLTNPFLHLFFASTHVCFFLTDPFLHFFFASTAVREPPPCEAAMAEPAGTANAAVANESAASTPATPSRAFRIAGTSFLLPRTLDVERHRDGGA